MFSQQEIIFTFIIITKSRKPIQETTKQQLKPMIEKAEKTIELRSRF